MTIIPFLLLIFLPTIHSHVPSSSSSSSPSSSSPSHHYQDYIHINCNTTLYSDLCFSSLSSLAKSIHNNPSRLARAAISVTLTKTLQLSTYISHFDGAAHPTVVAPLQDCTETLKEAVNEMRSSIKEMKEMVTTGSVQSFRFQMSNVKTWLSAALTNQNTCIDGFENVDQELIKDDVCLRVAYIKKLTSIALALVNRYADNVNAIQ